MNNKGIHLDVGVMDVGTENSGMFLAFLPCSEEGRSGSVVGVCLDRVSGTRDYFARCNSDLTVIDAETYRGLRVSKRRICVRQRQARQNKPRSLRNAIRGDMSLARWLLNNGARAGPESILQAISQGKESMVRFGQIKTHWMRLHAWVASRWYEHFWTAVCSQSKTRYL